MSKLVRLIALLSVLALVLVACGGDDGGTDDTEAAETTEAGDGESTDDDMGTSVLDVAIEAGQFSTLIAAIEAAGLADTLDGDGPFTVLAPTNAAFETALAELGISADDLLASDDLADILTYHVLPLAANSQAVSALDGEDVATVNGATIAIAVADGNITINERANVVSADLEADNGIVHVIDAVLLPPADEDGGDGDDGEASGPFVPEGLPTIDPLDADPSLTVGIAGSSTVFPLSTALMTKWEDEGGPNYPIDSIGSGGGIERFCVEGASDIANASRAIKEEEVTSCADIDRTIVEVRVGSDALTLVVSSGNYFATELTLEEIATAYSLTDQGATWADVNPDFPAHPIALFTPGTDSGTFDYFNEVVFDEADPSPIVSSIAQIVGEDDNVTVQGVSEDGCTEGDLSTTCAIGYFGFAFFQENSSVLQAVSVDGVEPNIDTVNDSSYPISRPLFMYTAEEVIAEKAHVAEFMAYYLTNVNEVIGDVGYFPAPDELLQEAADNLKAAAGW